MRPKSRPPAVSARIRIQAQVTKLARRQHRCVSREQLLDLGLSSPAIQRLLNAERLFRIHHGVYSLGPPPLTQHGEWMAATLACGPLSLISHRSAAALWGLARPGGLTHVTVEGSSPGSRRGIRLHRTRSLPPDDRSRRAGIGVTSVARTFVDQAGAVDANSLRRQLEEADRLDLLRIDAALAACDRANGRRGAGALRELLATHTLPAGTRSELEDRFLDLCRQTGLPAPETNVVVEGFEVDAFWPGARLVVELDGYVFHRSRAAFERDHARTAVLQSAGYEVCRFTWAQVTAEPALVVATVRRGLGDRTT